jgi:replicative DNA helicase
MDQLAAAVGAYQALPLAIDETPNLSVAQIRARCHALRRKKGNVDLCVIDHLRFITPADRHADERDQIQQITRDLKQMAKELNIAILLVVHLNRGIWSRDNKRPVLSDLYGSSGIEQNADHVWFLHREEYYLERQQPDCSDHKKYDEWLTRVLQSKGRAEVFSAKRRRGPLGSANLKFDAPFARFLDPGA